MLISVLFHALTMACEVIPLAERDPEREIYRNGVCIFNPAHFSGSPDTPSKQAQARELLEQIYSMPLDSQTIIADELVQENEDVAPLMWYEAIKTGHIDVSDAIKSSGKVGMSKGPDGWGDVVYDYKRKRANEVLEAAEAEKAAMLEVWLGEFYDEEPWLLV